VGAYHIREFWRGVENPNHIVEAREALNGHVAKSLSAGSKA
jgi:hypothetical protein